MRRTSIRCDNTQGSCIFYAWFLCQADFFGRETRPFCASSKILACISWILLTLAATLLQGKTWNVSPPGSGDWSNSANWTGGEPTVGDEAWFLNGGTANVTSPGEICNNIYLCKGTIQMSGGDLSTWIEYIGEAPDFDPPPHAGIFTQTGGINLVSSYLCFGSNLIDQNGSGTYNLNGGTLILSRDVQKNTFGTATFNIGGGTLRANADLAVPMILWLTGANGNASIDTQSHNVTLGDWVRGNGGLNKLGSGTLTISGNADYSGSTTTSGGLQFNGANSTLHSITGTGFLGVGGSTSSSALSADVIDVTDIGLGAVAGSSGSFSLNPGGYIAASSMGIGSFGSGVLTQSSANTTVDVNNMFLGTYTGSSGTYNFNNGVFNIGYLDAGSGTTVFNFGGGILRAKTNFTTDVPFTFTGINGDARIDTQGYTVAISNAVSGNGGLEKSGSGILTFSNNAAYLGATAIDAGTLRFDGADNTLHAVTGAGILEVGFNNCSTLTADRIQVGQIIFGRNAGGSATYSLHGSGAVSASYLSLGYYGAGVFNHSAATNTVTYLVCGEYSSNSNGAYNLSGTGTLSATNEYIGEQGVGAFNQSGGTNTLTGNLFIGDANSGSGMYNLNGAGQLTTVNEYIGNLGGGAFNQSGGTHTVTGTLYLGNASTGSGMFNFMGGTLNTKSLQKGTGTAIFNFGGGTLRATNAFTASAPITLTGVNGNAIVDTQNYNVTLSNAVAGNGGLKKLGAGKLILSGNAAYLGSTTIDGGLLQLNGVNSVLHAISGAGNLGVGDGVHPSALTATSIQVNTLFIGVGAKDFSSPFCDGLRSSSTPFTPIPEPNTLTLLLLAAAGLGWFGCRQRGR
jgi:autotransporter-associated beta strand protein